ncbi:MAG: phosphoribosylformylglycinamidine cyclo-ligase, partial [Thermoleophilia bacterium]|nr:phosphoribosylformylglycinamidine cyclo-ligase [Thermoleophilia bacterium]
LPVPPIFDLIAECGAVEEAEMYEVFNMGLGFVVVLPDADADAAVELLSAHHPESRVIGSVSDRAGMIDRPG